MSCFFLVYKPVIAVVTTEKVVQYERTNRFAGAFGVALEEFVAHRPALLILCQDTRVWRTRGDLAEETETDTGLTRRLAMVRAYRWRRKECRCWVDD